MVTERLDTAVKNFQHINQMVERYTRLSRAYVQLSERFHRLDVEHMTLKGQVVPLLRAFKAQQMRLQQAQAEQQALRTTLERQAAEHRQELQNLTQLYEDRLQTLTHHLEELKPLEYLFSLEVQEELTEAETQMELVEATLEEMAADSCPDLSAEEQGLLAAYRADPDAFLGSSVSPESPLVVAG